MHQLGKMLVILGVVIGGAGLLLMSGKIPGFGRLPGDIVHRGRNTTFYFPVVTCLILSAALTLVLWLARVFMRR